MRGVNYPYTWFQSRPTQQDLAAIAATGSNTVRLVLSTGGQWARVNGPQVTQLIQWCKDLRMIAVLEVHDSTGWSEQTTAVNISNAVQYWLSPDIRAAINGQENFVIINIANEPFGNNQSGVIGQALSAPLRVRATRGGAAAAGEAVTWTASGGQIVGSGPTGVDGNATATWTLSNTVGAHTATATSGGNSPAARNNASPSPARS
jgi:hypothetical protein